MFVVVVLFSLCFCFVGVFCCYDLFGRLKGRGLRVSQPFERKILDGISGALEKVPWI